MGRGIQAEWGFIVPLACEQAPSEGRKKFGKRKRDSVSEARRSVDPRAKRVGVGA